MASWYLQKNTWQIEVFAAAMVAGIVRTNIRMLLNPNGRNCYPKKLTSFHNFYSLAKKTSPEKIPVVLPSGKKEVSFFDLVHDVARLVPKGRVTSYGAIAAYLGAKSSSRMVGWAMNSSFTAKPKVPAHRVVNRNGMLSGQAHFATPTLMKELLQKEGIKVRKDTVVDFEKKFWDPGKELAL